MTTIENPGAAWLTGFRCQSESLRIGVPALDSEAAYSGDLVRRVYRVELSSETPATESESWETYLVAETTSPPIGKPVSPVAVHVVLQPQIKPVPSRLVFSSATSTDGSQEKKLLLLAAEDTVLGSVTVRPTPDWMEVVEQESDATNVAILVVRVFPSTTPSPVDGPFHLEVDCSRFGGAIAIRVPVEFR